MGNSPRPLGAQQRKSQERYNPSSPRYWLDLKFSILRQIHDGSALELIGCQSLGVNIHLTFSNATSP